MDEEDLVLCTTCLMLVRSTKKHFVESNHNSFHVPRDGILNLVCKDCEATFHHLAAAKIHMIDMKHTELHETAMDDDARLVIAVSPKHLDVLKRMGLLDESEDSASYLGRHSTSVDEITDGVKSVALESRDSVGVGLERMKIQSKRTLKNLLLPDAEIERLKEQYVLVEDTDREEAIRRIDALINSCQEENGDITFNLTNITQTGNTYVFDDVLKQVCLVKRMLCCSTKNAGQRDKAQRIYQMLSEIKKLLKGGRYMRIHEIPYRYPAIYESQRMSDMDLKEICGMTGVTRESLHIYTNPNGSVKGPVVLFIGKKILADCLLGGSSACKVPTEANKVTAVESRKDIAFILVVEKDTVFQALADMAFPERHNCIVITGCGQPSVSTRVLLRKLVDHLHIPLYGLFDANPSGVQIYSTYKYGSEGQSYDGVFLTNPTMKWLGLFRREVPKMHRTKMSDDDPKTNLRTDGRMNVLDTLMSKKHVQDDPEMRDALLDMESTREVAEIDILTRCDELERYILKKIKKFQKAN